MEREARETTTSTESTTSPFFLVLPKGFVQLVQDLVQEFRYLDKGLVQLYKDLCSRLRGNIYFFGCEGEILGKRNSALI
jgi:hypothetical protein